MSLDLTEKDIEQAKFAFSIYDFEGTEKLDAFYLGDCLRALDCTPTLKTISKFGGSDKKGERSFTIEEFLSIFGDAKKDNEIGCIPAYVDVLKCYDKYQDGRMLVTDLEQILEGSGEKFDHDTVEWILNECCDAPDDEGNIKYEDFIHRICAGPTSPFDDFDLKSLDAPPKKPKMPAVVADSGSDASATISLGPRKLRPSITVEDEDKPQVNNDSGAETTATISLGPRKSRPSLGVTPEELPNNLDDNGASATVSLSPRKLRPSVTTVDDEDVLSVSYAAAKPLAVPDTKAEDDGKAASITLKAPKKAK